MRRYSILAALTIAAALGCAKEPLEPQPPRRLPAADLRPGQAVLFEAIDRANRIQVVDADPPHGRMLFESVLPQDRAALKQALSGFEEDPNLFWPGIGDPIIRLYAGSEIVAELGYSQTILVVEAARPASGKLILMTDKQGEKVNEDPENPNEAFYSRKLSDWFFVHGAAAPREQYEKFAVSSKAALEDERRFFAAMPKSLRPFWKEMRQTGRVSAPAPCERPDVTKFSRALKNEFSSDEQQILALFGWLGAAEGYDYPDCGGYEDFPVWLLLEHPSGRLIDIATKPGLPGPHLLGALRFFGGPHFARSRPADLRKLRSDLAKDAKSLREASPQQTTAAEAAPAKNSDSGACWDFYTHLQTSCETGVTDSEFQRYRSACIEGGTSMNCSLVLTRAEFEKRKKAAAGGDAQAAADLASHFTIGIGAGRLAVPWMRRAGELGRKDQQAAYGEALVEAATSPEQAQEGLRLIEAAAYEGEKYGAYTLWRLLEEGKGNVPRNPELAACWRDAGTAIMEAEENGGKVRIACRPLALPRPKEPGYVEIPKAKPINLAITGGTAAH